jgi:predicted phage terminase large subunit-like protein
MILKWTTEQKEKISSRQLAIMKEVADDPTMAAAAETLPELILRPEQAPYLYYKKKWNTWLFCAGRGAGKTRSGVEWILYEIKKAEKPLIFSIVCPTQNDVVRTLIEGESGFLKSTPPWMELNWRQKDNVLFFKGGHVVRCFSSESPERLRGMNAHHCLMDELAAWEPQNVSKTIHQVLLSTRLKDVDNKIVITTTPINIPYLRNLIKKRAKEDDLMIMTTGTTYDNAQNLGQSFFENVISEIEGSSFARQELYGELLDSDGEPVFQEDDFMIWPWNKRLPKFHKIVIGIDSAFTENTKNDPSGCVVLGVFWDTSFISSENGNKGDYSIMVLDCWRKWYNFNSLVDSVREMWDTEYGADIHPGKLPDAIAIENRGSGISLLQHLVNYKNRFGENMNLVKRQATNDKFVRISLACPITKAGRVYVMGGHNTKFAPWVEDLIAELVDIPNGEHDDLADAFAHAVLYLKDSNWVEMDFPDRIPPKPEYDTDYTPTNNSFCPYGE